MRELEASCVLDRDCATVWNYVTDLERTPEWRTTVRTVEAPASLDVGERFGATTRVLGRTWRWELETTAHEPGRRFAYAVVGGVAPIEVEYRLEPNEGGGCGFTLAAGLAGGRTRWRDELLARMVGPVLRRETRRHLDNLRRRLS